MIALSELREAVEKLIQIHEEMKVKSKTLDIALEEYIKTLNNTGKKCC
ncbi:hypothetical protein N752_28725 [Desulforamulus aquiferis]|nr:hypothetical protein [Desulforamulus aquiferis]RYD01562.1 hypothetical protein N752_28725 [Desulforamulus aquiferis]